jgi:hypothetical protein
MITSDAIVSPSRVFKALSSDDLRRSAPSVFADHPRPGVSARYTFVSTEQVIDLLRGEGWEPVKATEQRVRLEARVGFQMHEIRFTRRADIDVGAFQVGSTRPEMVLQNAHDGTRAYPSLAFVSQIAATSHPGGPCSLPAVDGGVLGRGRSEEINRGDASCAVSAVAARTSERRLDQ